MILVDVDHFKRFNDTFGHKVGDECLLQIAGALVHAGRRAGDLVARYGGDEFVALLPDTDQAGGTAVAQAMLREVHDLDIQQGNPSLPEPVTVSLGLAYRDPMAATPIDAKALFENADKALRRAKTRSRDAIGIAGQETGRLLAIEQT